MIKETTKARVLCCEYNPHGVCVPMNPITEYKNYFSYFSYFPRAQIVEKLERFEEMNRHFSEQLHAQTALLNKINPKTPEVVTS